eukprot:UC1_evm1s1481
MANPKVAPITAVTARHYSAVPPLALAIFGFFLSQVVLTLNVAPATATTTAAAAAATLEPATCASGSVSANASYCNPSLPYAQRANLMASAMTQEEKLMIWQGHGLQPGVPRLNVKSYRRDTICFQGVALNTEDSPWQPPHTTVFPNAINWGSSWDFELIEAAANVTGAELRGVNELSYASSGGASYTGPVCDVGPMSNTVHDPRWGRIAQVYSEDPFLSGAIASRVVSSIQARAPGAGPGGALRVRAAVTVGLFVGYHGDKSGQVPSTSNKFLMPLRDLYDQYLPSFRAALSGEEQALGVMCSHAAMNSTPSCANSFLLKTLLRDTWDSKAMVRSDCCGDPANMVGKGYVSTVEDAIVATSHAGLQYCFGCGNGHGNANTSRVGYADAIAKGRLSEASLTNAVAAALLPRFYTGEFDRDPTANVYGKGYAASVDSPAHRKVARDLAAASVVLLENDGILPLKLRLGDADADADAAAAAAAAGLGASDASSSSSGIAVIGPFGNCTALPEAHGRRGSLAGWQSPNCYLHNYAGSPSSVSTVANSLRSAFSSASPVYFEPGTGPGSSIKRAVSLARSTRTTILCLGLGNDVEIEGKDRNTLQLPLDQEVLLQAVRAATPRLVVVLFAAGPVDRTGGFLGNATLLAGYGGEEAGAGLTDILTGVVSPSGRLPVSWVRESYLQHIGGLKNYTVTAGAGRTYRYIHNTSSFVRYPFGHGLSYTSFVYTQATARPTTTNKDKTLAVQVSVANAGTRAGREVVQVYVTVPQPAAGYPVPRYSLCGVHKTQLLHVPSAATAVEEEEEEEEEFAASTETVVLNVDYSCLKTVRPDGTRYLNRTGTYRVFVGGGQPGSSKSVVEVQVPGSAL